jgi:hypothetical protein
MQSVEHTSSQTSPKNMIRCQTTPERRAGKSTLEGMVSKQGNSSSRMRSGMRLVHGASGVADDDPSTLFAQDAPLFRLGTPVPTLFTTEKAKHARRLLGSLRVLYEGGALVSHLGPRSSFVENYLYASAHASTALRAARAAVHGTRKGRCRRLGTVRREVICSLTTLRCGRISVSSMDQCRGSQRRATAWRLSR